MQETIDKILQIAEDIEIAISSDNDPDRDKDISRYAWEIKWECKKLLREERSNAGHNRQT